MIDTIEQAPDIFAISIASKGDFLLVEKIFKDMKAKFPNVKIYVGGSYPTLSPSEIEENKYIDAICIGEG